VAIAILDAGGQYCHLLGRRIRDMGVAAEILPLTVAPSQLQDFDGIIISGGPQSVHKDGLSLDCPSILEMGKPILGICYGMQLIVHLFGGEVAPADAHIKISEDPKFPNTSAREFGEATLYKTNAARSNSFFIWVPDEGKVWMSHEDTIEELPEGFELLGSTDRCKHAAIWHPEKKIYGLQFHPETEPTEFGQEFLYNFVCGICKASILEDTNEFLVDDLIADIQQRVGDRRVFFLVSGGVDSLVAYTLCQKALPAHQLHGIHINTGLLRYEDLNLHLPGVITYNRELEFLDVLKGMIDPESKRAAIGYKFVDVLRRDIQEKLPEKSWVLGQGTIFADYIESGGVETAAKIKTHHNRVPEIIELDKEGRLLEPLRYLYKDQVRELGRQLGISEDLLNKHPSPGPCLAIRIQGEVTLEKLEILQRADFIFISELRTRGFYDKIWQAFCVLLADKTVGVQGDKRSYGHAVALRAVHSIDGMTADWYDFPSDVLRAISTHITNDIPEINRVVYDITSKPPATIEWE